LRGDLLKAPAERAPPRRAAGVTMEETVDCFVREALRTCVGTSCEGNCSVFLTTDSPQAQRAFIKAMAPVGVHVVVSTGAITHLEHSKKSNASEHLKTFADWWTLSRMSRLIASRSGFSETAGWAANVPARALVGAGTCLFSNGVEAPDGAEFMTMT